MISYSLGGTDRLDDELGLEDREKTYGPGLDSLPLSTTSLIRGQSQVLNVNP